jgi:hypothetical protein
MIHLTLVFIHKLLLHFLVVCLGDRLFVVFPLALNLTLSHVLLFLDALLYLPLMHHI